MESRTQTHRAQDHSDLGHPRAESVDVVTLNVLSRRHGCSVHRGNYWIDLLGRVVTALPEQLRPAAREET